MKYVNKCIGFHTNTAVYWFPCMESTCQAPQVLNLLVKSMGDIEGEAQLGKRTSRWNTWSRKPANPEANPEIFWMFDFSRENTNFI